MKSVGVRITGVVQGVGYRAWTEAEARARSLSGWVRNRRDGSVEALIAGPESVVDDMLAALWRGPPASDVTGVAAEPSEAPAGQGFRTLPTA